MTMNDPAPALTPPARLVLRVTTPEPNVDFAGSILQSTASEPAAKPACGIAVVKISAASVAVTIRRAVEEIMRVIGASMAGRLFGLCRAPQRSLFPMLDDRHDGRRPSADRAANRRPTRRTPSKEPSKSRQTGLVCVKCGAFGAGASAVGEL